MFRDNQNYDAMISLIDELSRIKNTNVVDITHIRYLYAFALTRRNQKGDHEKALRTVEEIIENTEDQAGLSPDIICLAGRIYKDKFIASNYEDKESLNKAIQW